MTRPDVVAGSHLEATLAQLRAELETRRASLNDVRAVVRSLPSSRIDGVAWGEERQRIDADIRALDEAYAAALRRFP